MASFFYQFTHLQFLQNVSSTVHIPTSLHRGSHPNSANCFLSFVTFSAHIALHINKYKFVLVQENVIIGVITGLSSTARQVITEQSLSVLSVISQFEGVCSFLVCQRLKKQSLSVVCPVCADSCWSSGLPSD